MSASPLPEELIAWGQYMHWAEIQFQQFKTFDLRSDLATGIGVAAHWLATEYVVLEGWLELEFQSTRITDLLDAYPEHRDFLRRCRNAVFHYQKQALDPRLSRVLSDEQEELKWSIALHYEFQGHLTRVVAALASRSPDPNALHQTIAGAIGWFPEHPLAAQISELYGLVAKIAMSTAGDDSDAAAELKLGANSMLRTIDELDLYPLSSSLKRMPPRKAV